VPALAVVPEPAPVVPGPEVDPALDPPAPPVVGLPFVPPGGESLELQAAKRQTIEAAKAKRARSGCIMANTSKKFS
jgi:hypothetical protein